MTTSHCATDEQSSCRHIDRYTDRQTGGWMIDWHIVRVHRFVCLRQSHAAHELHRDAIHGPGHSSGRLAAVFVLRLNVPHVFALIPQFTMLRSKKERALDDSIFFCATTREPSGVPLEDGDARRNTNITSFVAPTFYRVLSACFSLGLESMCRG